MCDVGVVFSLQLRPDVVPLTSGEPIYHCTVTAYNVDVHIHFVKAGSYENSSPAAYEFAGLTSVLLCPCREFQGSVHRRKGLWVQRFILSSHCERILMSGRVGWNGIT